MKKAALILSLILYAYGCKKNKPEPPPPGDPTAATLVQPADNTVCQEGVVEGQKLTVTFQWRAGENTDNYSLTIKNLKSNAAITKPTSKNETTATLDRATPYSWFVISRSKSSNKTAQSPVWKFYTSGEGQVSHPPFPAAIVTPENGSHITAPKGEITLDWEGKDVDGDIESYDVYFGKTNPPVDLKQADLQESILEGVEVSSNTMYYWYVKTKDKQGNVSNSVVAMFRVNP